jgi:hypothetical protein
MESRRMKIGSWLVVAFILCLLPITASAEMERTIGTWDTKIAGQGDIQTSLYTGYETWNNPSYGTGNSTSSTLYLAYGVNDDLSVGVAPSFYGWDIDGVGAQSGISDTGIYTVYRLRDKSIAGFDLALFSNVSLPTGDEDKALTSDKTEALFQLLGSRDFGDVVGVFNVGFNRIFNPSDGQKSYQVESAFEGILQINDLWSVNGILDAYTTRWDVSDHDVYSDLGLGVHYAPNDKSFVSLSAYKGLASRTYDWYVQIGVGMEF